MARRQSSVLRNLDDPLRILGLLTFRSCGVVLMFFAMAALVDFVLGVWTFLFGQWSLFAELVMTALVATALRMVERHDDEHVVPSALQYYLERPWRVVYSAGIPEDFRGHRLEWVLHER